MDHIKIARSLISMHGLDGRQYALVELQSAAGFAILRDGGLVQQTCVPHDQLEECTTQFMRLTGLTQQADHTQQADQSSRRTSFASTENASDPTS